MPVFGSRYYTLAMGQPIDIETYRKDVQAALRTLEPSAKRHFLVEEIKETTRHITDGIRDIVKKDKRIRDLVLNQGALPLGTWAKALDSLAEHSVDGLKATLAEMQNHLEHGKIQGFPATMFLYHKPTFVTFEPFYAYIFSLLDPP